MSGKDESVARASLRLAGSLLSTKDTVVLRYVYLTIKLSFILIFFELQTVRCCCVDWYREDICERDTSKWAQWRLLNTLSLLCWDCFPVNKSVCRWNSNVFLIFSLFLRIVREWHAVRRVFNCRARRHSTHTSVGAAAFASWTRSSSRDCVGRECVVAFVFLSLL